jgi:hypothetical protein
MSKVSHQPSHRVSVATQQPSTPPNTDELFSDEDDVSKWDSEKLRTWLQSRSPPALGETAGPCCQNFTAAKVSGLAFLHSNAEEFECKYGVLYSVAKTLTVLASRINATDSRKRLSPAVSEEGGFAPQESASRNPDSVHAERLKSEIPRSLGRTRRRSLTGSSASFSNPKDICG